MLRGSIACGWFPAIASTEITDSCIALCASHGGAVTSPIAQMPGTLVRHIASVSIWPLVVFTPSASSPIFSVFGTIPIATIAWLNSAYRSEEHTSDIQSLMRISYAVFCSKKKHHLLSTHLSYIQ